MQVAINDFKAGISNYIALTRQGQVLEITSHKRPVARVTGIRTAIDSTPLAAMIAAGEISWSGKKPVLPESINIQKTPRSMSEQIIQDRG